MTVQFCPTPSRRDTWRLASVATRHTSTSVLLLNLPLRFGSTRLPADRCFPFPPWILLRVVGDLCPFLGAFAARHGAPREDRLLVLDNRCVPIPSPLQFIVFTVWICEILWPLDLDIDLCIISDIIWRQLVKLLFCLIHPQCELIALLIVELAWCSHQFNVVVS